MNMREMDNENPTQANATRVYTIHTTQMHNNKYIKHLNQQQQK